jgi:hypothetical protein
MQLSKILPLCLLLTSLSAMAQSVPEAGAKEAANPQPAKQQDIDLPVPVGMPISGIKVPSYDENGNLLLLLEAETAEKTDEKTIKMEQLKMEAMDEEGRKIFVELPQAVLNLDTRILTGDKTALIRREDFTITGDSIEFNTKTRFGKMRGNIKMVISTEDTAQ